MKRNERGISLIALVITIIVIIILAAIAFSSSTRTITEANKSNIINNISEVSSAFHTKSVTVEGKKAAEGNTKTDAQVYNYVAKGGKEEEDFLVRAEIPAYTIIKENADIGIKLPKMKLESGTGKLIDVKYAATKEGKIFIWPPYEDEGKYYITDKDMVETKMTTNIKVGNESLTIKLNPKDGSLIDADGIGITKPTVKDTEYIYNNGAKIELNISGFDEETMVLEGAVEGTAVGEYTATIKLKDKENTTWSDGTTDDITINWKISKNEIYATLYDDGTLVLSNNDSKVEGKTVSKDYGQLNKYSDRNWASDQNSIKTVDIVNKIAPKKLSMWFAYCTNLTTINNLSNIDTSNVTSMENMFNSCSSLISIDLSGFDISKVTKMGSMFENCSTLENVYLNGLNTSNAKEVGRMFYNCSNLKSVKLSGFQVSGSMNYMFYDCKSLTDVDLSGLNTSAVSSMSSMFYGCNSLTNLNLNGFDTSSVTNMSRIFQSCSSLESLDLSSFSTKSATNMDYMFLYNSNLKTIYVNKDWIMLETAFGVFSGCGTQEVTVKDTLGDV